MRKGFLGSLAALLTGGGLALGQGYQYPPAGYYPPPAHPGWQMHPMQMQQMQMQQMQMQQMQQMPMRPMPMQPMPMHPMMAQPMMGHPMPRPVVPANMVGPGMALPGMPQGYGQPYYPDRPVVRGWPPPPGTFPPAPGTIAGAPALMPSSPAKQYVGSVASTTAADKSTVQSADSKGITPPAVLPTTGKSVLGLPMPQRGAAFEPVQGQPVLLNKHKHHQHSTPEPMLNPVPGTPLWCEDGSCSSGECAPECQPNIPHRTPRGYKGYAKGEFLYWFIRPQESPVLFNVTVPRGVRAIEAQEVDNEERMGGRLTLGYWFNCDQTLALEAIGFYMADRDERLGATGALSRPFFNLATGAEAVAVLPAGSTAAFRNQARLYGGEVNLRWEVARWGWGHLDLLAGARFMQLDEALEIVTTSGNTRVADSFGTQNQFWGGQVGIEGEVNWERYFLNGYVKLAAGDLIQTVNIFGQTQVGVDLTRGGFLARPTNIGRYRRDTFGLLPEAGANVGMRLTDNLRVFGGYNIFYLLDAVRPAEQIDRSLNFTATGFPGPIFRLNDTAFWAQGVTGGLEIRY